MNVFLDIGSSDCHLSLPESSWDPHGYFNLFQREIDSLLPSAVLVTDVLFGFPSNEMCQSLGYFPEESDKM